MGWNFRKSVKILPGVKLNFSKKGLSGISFGGKGARTTINTKGGVRQTFGIPGTGLSYTTNWGKKKKK